MLEMGWFPSTKASSSKDCLNQHATGNHDIMTPSPVERSQSWRIDDFMVKVSLQSSGLLFLGQSSSSSRCWNGSKDGEMTGRQLGFWMLKGVCIKIHKKTTIWRPCMRAAIWPTEAELSSYPTPLRRSNYTSNQVVICTCSDKSMFRGFGSIIAFICTIVWCSNIRWMPSLFWFCISTTSAILLVNDKSLLCCCGFWHCHGCRTKDALPN